MKDLDGLVLEKRVEKIKFITDYKQLGGDENKSVNNYLSSKPIEKKI